MEELLYPEANAIIDQVQSRHAMALPFVMEAIDMAHLAFDRIQDMTSRFVPGIPGVRRARNDINDNCWRYLRLIADPLLDDGVIQDFDNIDGGNVMIMPDGLHIRVKKSDRNGKTSNFPTQKIRRMSRSVTQDTLFGQLTELDAYIKDGHWIDITYAAGESLATYNHVGVRFSNAYVSPYLILDPPNQTQLRRISPAAFDLIAEARAKLTA